MKLIIDIPKDDYELVQKYIYPQRIFYEVTHGTPIPDNATNGDVIKAIFPCSKYNEYFADVEMKTEENDTRFKAVFDRDWWNAPYQKGGKE